MKWKRILEEPPPNDGNTFVVFSPVEGIEHNAVIYKDTIRRRWYDVALCAYIYTHIENVTHWFRIEEPKDE